MSPNNKISLTIFTPTYNRAHTLPRTYESLLRQTRKDFIWLIIDDGSTDNTADIVREWQSRDNGFWIQYIHKKNGGLHTAYNAAIEQLETELSMCIDSDDWLVDDAVEMILAFWEKNGSDSVAGIEALDRFEDGTIIGDKMPSQKTINLIDLTTGKYHLRNGDKKPIVRSELYKSVAPMPTFDGEKNFNPHYMHLLISLKYDFLVMNEPVCVVEYQRDGMSNAIFRQYMNSPNSFAELRRLCMRFKDAPLKFKLKNAIHYDSSCFIAGKPGDIVRKSSKPFLTAIMTPFGGLLAIMIKFLSKK